MAQKVRQIIVAGAGAFPISMLSVDGVFPATPADAEAIAATLAQTQASTQPRHITLVLARPGSYSPLRWATLGWEIISETR